MIFELVEDFAAALETMPPEHPRRKILSLLEEAIRRDIHFIDRHPTTLFQGMLNFRWWYNWPEAGEHFIAMGLTGMRLCQRSALAQSAIDFKVRAEPFRTFRSEEFV